MSMKKKFLALALAGAVAMPVVANATNNGVIQGPNSASQTGNVNISGTVNTSQGTAAAGQISVQLPIDMGFVVHPDSRVQTGNAYTVVNKGADPISLSLTNFTETEPTTGITIKKSSDITSTPNSFNRSNVGLKLTGDSGKTVDIGTFMETKKTTPNHEQVIFSKISGSQNGTHGQATMVLNGVAGTQADATVDKSGASENFVATFKVTKVNL